MAMGAEVGGSGESCDLFSETLPTEAEAEVEAEAEESVEEEAFRELSWRPSLLLLSDDWREDSDDNRFLEPGVGVAEFEDDVEDVVDVKEVYEGTLKVCCRDLREKDGVCLCNCCFSRCRSGRWKSGSWMVGNSPSLDDRSIMECPGPLVFVDEEVVPKKYCWLFLCGLFVLEIAPGVAADDDEDVEGNFLAFWATRSLAKTGRGKKDGDEVEVVGVEEYCEELM